MGTVQTSNSRGRCCLLPLCGTLAILWALGPLAAGAEPVVLRGESIRISISTARSRGDFPLSRRRLLVRFASVDPNIKYKIIVNGGAPVSVRGQELLAGALDFGENRKVTGT